MKQILLIPALAASLALALTACSKPDEAALAKSDEALKGQMAGGELRAVASRPVMVGQGGAQASGGRQAGGRGISACAALVTIPEGTTRAVHWSNIVGPAKAEVTGAVWRCESDGAWTGIIFPAHGQDSGDCRADERLARPREYQGPCRWGWVQTSELPAG
jgi:hypothetical protein